MTGVTIIIANYNGENFLDPCLSSVLRSIYKFDELIIVDDGSSDRSIDIINKYIKKDKRIILLKNSKNLGASACRNIAAKKAKGTILVFLDNDTQVDKNWLKELLKGFKDDEVGACQSMIREYNNHHIIQNPGMKLWAATGWGLPLGQGIVDAGQFLTGTDIIAISASLAVRKKVFDAISGFDEDEAVFTEDIDLSWRIWLCGFRVILVPLSIVYHWTKDLRMRESMKHSEEIIYFHITKNSFASILKCYEKKNLYKYFIQAFFIEFGRSLLVFIKRNNIHCFIGTLKGFVWNLLFVRKTLKKRYAIQGIRNFSDSQLFGRIIVTDSVKEIYNKYFFQTKLI